MKILILGTLLLGTINAFCQISIHCDFKRSEEVNDKVIFSINNGYNPSHIDTSKYIKLYNSLLENLKDQLNDQLKDLIIKSNKDAVSIIVKQPMIFIESDDKTIYLTVPVTFISDKQKGHYKLDEEGNWFYSNSFGIDFNKNGKLIMPDKNLNWLY